MEDKRLNPIGIFDSGVGGISVLKETMKLLPGENYIYIGDSKRAPYGCRPVEEIREISEEITEELIKKGAKAVVVACNTATSAAVSYLREKYTDIPIVGTEPALKPAVAENPEGTVLVLATMRTLEEKKFADLLQKVASQRKVISLPMVGLVELIESGKKDSEETFRFIESKLYGTDLNEVTAAVLGCTHYPFIRHHLERLLPGVSIYDGARGISRRLKEILDEKGLKNPGKKGKTEIINTGGNDFKLLSENLLYK